MRLEEVWVALRAEVIGFQRFGWLRVFVDDTV